jgi:hypothetical protein
MKTNCNVFWLNDLILFFKCNYNNIFPSNNLSKNQKLNYIVMICIYIILLLLIFKKYQYLSYPITLILLTILLHSYDDECNSITEQFIDNSNNEKNNNNNTDDNDNNDNVNNDNKTNINNNNNNINNNDNDDDDLYKSIDNLIDKKNIERQFFANPINSVPSDQTNFAKLLYSNL